MRMPRSQFRFDSNLKRGFLDAFVKLKQMRVTCADADPNNLHVALRRESSDFFDRQKECAKLNRAQFFAERKIDILRNVREKTEREMQLIARSPVHAANTRIEINQKFSNRLRWIDRNKKTLHFRGRISAPDLGSSPLGLTCDGKERLKTFIARAIKFGNTAFAAMMK